MVFGPITQTVDSSGQVNTSNQLIRDLVLGNHTNRIPETGLFYWADVREVATAHVKSLRTPASENQRFILCAGFYTNKELCDIIREELPEYASRTPSREASGGTLPDGGIADIDNSRAITTLGMVYRPLRASVIDVVKSLESAGLVEPPKQRFAKI